MLKRFFFGLALAAIGLVAPARAQEAVVLGSCGAPPLVYPVGAVLPMTMDTTGHLCSTGGGGGAVTSVANVDGSLTVSPTTGSVLASLNPAHANTWSAIQTFSATNGIVYSGAAVGTQVACLGLDASNNIIKSAAACGSGGGGGTVTSVAAGCGTTASPSPITATGTIFAAEVPNLRAGTTYTIANADCGTLNNFSNAAAIAVTLPQAGSGGNFTNGWYNDVCSIGAGTATITPTTSTIGGVATLVLTTNKCARIVSDGTNYQVVTYGGGGGGGTPGGSPSNVQFNSAGAFGGDAGFTYTTLGQVTIAGGTITTNNKALTITQTWNNAAVTFDAPLFMNITSTASAAGSLVADLQVGGSNVFNVNKTGLVTLPEAGVFPPIAGIRFGTGQPAYIYVNNTGILDLEFSANNNAPVMALWGANTIFLNSIAVLNWKVAPLGSGVLGDIGLVRGAASYLALYNPASPATGAGLAVYNTVDTAIGPTNYERGVFDWTTQTSPVALSIGSQSSGTGSARPVLFVSSGMFAAAGPALPACNTTAVPGYPNGTKGFQAVVSDATAPTYNATYTSGGAIVAHVVCNGTNWVTQ